MTEAGGPVLGGQRWMMEAAVTCRAMADRGYPGQVWRPGFRTCTPRPARLGSRHHSIRIAPALHLVNEAFKGHPRLPLTSDLLAGAVGAPSAPAGRGWPAVGDAADVCGGRLGSVLTLASEALQRCRPDAGRGARDRGPSASRGSSSRTEMSGLRRSDCAHDGALGSRVTATPISP